MIWTPTRFESVKDRGAVRVEIGRRNSAWLYGKGLARMLDELGIPHARDWHPDRRRVLMCPVDRVGDLLALLEHRDKRVVEVMAVEW
ncbi:hypothetical protein ACI8AA_06875 [Geodermatophilus sp. SYSU D01180]